MTKITTTAALALAIAFTAPVFAETIDENTKCATVRKVLLDKADYATTIAKIWSVVKSEFAKADRAYVLAGRGNQAKFSFDEPHLIATVPDSCAEAEYLNQTLKQRSWEIYEVIR